MRVFGVEPDLAAIIGLSVLSAAVGKGLVMQMRQYRVRGNLFALASAPSGEGRSSCFRPFVHPLQGIEDAFDTRHADRNPGNGSGARTAGSRSGQTQAGHRRDEEIFQRLEETALLHGAETKAGRVISLRDILRRNCLAREQLEALVRRHPDRLGILTQPPGNKGGRPSEVLRFKSVFP